MMTFENVKYRNVCVCVCVSTQFIVYLYSIPLIFSGNGLSLQRHIDKKTHFGYDGLILKVTDENGKFNQIKNIPVYSKIIIFLYTLLFEFQK